MRLPALKIGVGVPASSSSDAVIQGDDAGAACQFCDQRAGLHAMRIGVNLACVLCGLVQSLHRPAIDDEVRLIWLPKLTQAALNVLVRQIHIELRGLGESLYCEDIPKSPQGMRPTLYVAQRILLKGSAVIAERLGSALAGDLADALTGLTRRHVAVDALPFGGLRVLPAGRFYVGGTDVYAEIVDSWRAPAPADNSSRRPESMAEAA
jgi:hypothetical protein